VIGKSVACRRTESPAFDDAATNMAKSIATNVVDVDARRMYFA